MNSRARRKRRPPGVYGRWARHSSLIVADIGQEEKQMRTIRRWIPWAGLAAAAMLVGSGAHAQGPSYSVEELGERTSESWAFSINGYGAVVGCAKSAGGSTERGFWWSEGVAR